MSNGLHSQAWLIASKVLVVVTVTLFTGGRLYFVNNQFIPAPLSESFHPQSPRIASKTQGSYPAPAAPMNTSGFAMEKTSMFSMQRALRKSSS